MVGGARNKEAFMTQGRREKGGGGREEMCGKVWQKAMLLGSFFMPLGALNGFIRHERKAFAVTAMSLEIPKVWASIQVFVFNGVYISWAWVSLFPSLLRNFQRQRKRREKMTSKEERRTTTKWGEGSTDK